MKPWELARGVYRSECCARSLLSDLAWHRLYGHVIETDNVLAFGRPVLKESGEANIIENRKVFSAEHCNAWFVWLVAGDMREAWSRIPFPLPWIGYERNNKLKWRRFDDLAKRMD